MGPGSVPGRQTPGSFSNGTLTNLIFRDRGSNLAVGRHGRSTLSDGEGTELLVYLVD